MNTTRCIAVALLGLALPAIAAAEPTESIDQPRGDGMRLGVEGSIGAATPLGMAGVSIELEPVPWARISAGVGAGLNGPQFALMAHWVHAGEFWFGEAGGGYSQGEFHHGDNWVFPDDAWGWEPAHWLNGEVAGGFELATGFRMRAFAGGGWILDGKPDTCRDNLNNGCRNPEVGSIGTLYVGLGVGYLFGL